MVRRPVADRLSGSQAALPVLRAALKPIAATESVNEVVKQVQDAAIQTVSAASRVGPVRDLDFDAFMHLGVTAWERADAAWTARLEAAFYAHASVVRVDEHGVTMQSVEGVEATPDADDRKEGYRCVLQQPSTCEAALRDVDATLSAEEVCACPLGQIARPPREEQRLTFTAAQLHALAQAAASLFSRQRREEFLALWPSHRWGRDTRTFYYNTETRERRWSRPAFDPSTSTWEAGPGAQPDVHSTCRGKGGLTHGPYLAQRK